jgi:hypothetical protein
MMLCPACAAQTPPVVWSLIGAFLLVPFLVVGVVALAIRRALGKRSPVERP